MRLESHVCVSVCVRVFVCVWGSLVSLAVVVYLEAIAGLSLSLTHTQALPRQRCVVNNRRAMTEGRHTHKHRAASRLKMGVCVMGELFIDTSLIHEGRKMEGGSGDTWRRRDICISNTWEDCIHVTSTAQSIFQPHQRVRWLPPHLLTLHTHHSYELLSQYEETMSCCDNDKRRKKKEKNEVFNDSTHRWSFIWFSGSFTTFSLHFQVLNKKLLKTKYVFCNNLSKRAHEMSSSKV